MENQISALTAAQLTVPAHDKGTAKPKTPAETVPQTSQDQVIISKPSSAAPETGKTVKVSVVPQDPLVSAAEVINFPKAEIGAKLSGERVKVFDSGYPVAIADTDGNYFYKVGSPEFDQVQAHTVTYRVLDMYQDLLGRKVDWAFREPQMRLLPHAGEDANAYYARQEESLNFFYFDSKPLQKTIQTSESVDIVAHETGHAVLDALRPRYLGSFGGNETMATHEAFGDITSTLFALTDAGNQKAVLAENQGDLRKPSLITRLAEEFGKALHLEDKDPRNDDQIFLRSTLNDFTYKTPASLPTRGGQDTLTGEPHNFSRLLTATVYDCLEGIYQQNLKTSGSQPEALQTAGADLRRIFARATEFLPVTSVKYKDVAQSMLKADQELTGGKYQTVMQEVFQKRQILSAPDPSKSKTDNLADLRLEQKPANEADALKVIAGHRKALSLPDDLKVDNYYSNDRGETFIHYSFMKEVPVKGEGLEQFEAQGVVVPLYGGLNLIFNAEGKLIHSALNKVDRARIKEAMAEIRNYAQNGLIKDEQPQEPVFKSKKPEAENKLYRAEVVTSSDDNQPVSKKPSKKKILVKIPVIQ